MIFSAGFILNDIDIDDKKCYYLKDGISRDILVFVTFYFDWEEKPWSFSCSVCCAQ